MSTDKKTCELQGNPLHKVSVGFSTGPSQPEDNGTVYSKCWKKKAPNYGILYPTKLSFKTGGEIKTFPDKQKLSKSITITPTFQEMLKGVLQGEMTLISNIKHKKI